MDSGYKKSLEIRGVKWVEHCSCGKILSQSKPNAYVWDSKTIVTPNGCEQCKDVADAQRIMGRLGLSSKVE